MVCELLTCGAQQEATVRAAYRTAIPRCRLDVPTSGLWRRSDMALTGCGPRFCPGTHELTSHTSSDRHGYLPLLSFVEFA